MIASLSGKVKEVGVGSVVIEAGGVGYAVAVPIRILGEFKKGQTVEIWTYHHLREDSSQLFGFRDREDERIFAQLLGVNGVGPKVALALLSLGSAKNLEGWIEAGDVARLTAMPGVGRKIAERIVLELGGGLTKKEAGGASSELEAALVGLGYKASEAREVLAKVDEKLPESEQLKEALKMLAK